MNDRKTLIVEKCKNARNWSYLCFLCFAGSAMAPDDWLESRIFGGYDSGEDSDGQKVERPIDKGSEAYRRLKNTREFLRDTQVDVFLEGMDNFAAGAGAAVGGFLSEAVSKVAQGALGGVGSGGTNIGTRIGSARSMRNQAREDCTRGGARTISERAEEDRAMQDERRSAGLGDIRRSDYPNLLQGRPSERDMEADRLKSLFK